MSRSASRSSCRPKPRPCASGVTTIAVMRQVVAALEPAWSGPVDAAATLGWDGVTDVRLARELLGPWTDELVAAGTGLGA